MLDPRRPETIAPRPRYRLPHREETDVAVVLILVGTLVWLTLVLTLASGFHYIYRATRTAGKE